MLTYKIGDVTRRKIREDPFITRTDEPFIGTGKGLTHPSNLTQGQRSIRDACAKMQKVIPYVQHHRDTIYTDRLIAVHVMGRLYKRYLVMIST